MKDPTVLTSGHAAKSIIGFKEAYDQAQKSLSEGGIPIGAALVLGENIVSSGHNERVQQGDPIAHGEMTAIKRAGRRRDYRDMTLFTTLAPCAMCTGAILLFGIPKVVVGEAQTFSGSLDYLRSYGVEVSLIDDDDCVQLMDQFRRAYPDIWAEDIGQ